MIFLFLQRQYLSLRLAEHTNSISFSSTLRFYKLFFIPISILKETPPEGSYFTRKTGSSSPAFCLVIFFFRWTQYPFQDMLHNSAKTGQQKAPILKKGQGLKNTYLYSRLRRSGKRNRYGGLDDIHGPVLLPLAPAPPCRDMASHFCRELIPATAGGKHVNHGLQRSAGICRRASSPGTGGNVGLELAPLSIGELIRHRDSLPVYPGRASTCLPSG